MRATERETAARKAAWENVEILIVGAGTMGASLTQAYAQSGFSVGVIDVSENILERAKATIDKELTVAQEKGIFSESQVIEIKGRIVATTSYEEACRGKALRLVIETATEDIEIKKKIFKTLDTLCAPEVVFASNTSSLDINTLAKVTKRTDKVVWMHYFYLPHKNKAGEYAGADTTSSESIALAAKSMKLAGKIATPILSSRKGGAADVIFVSLLLEAARMVDESIDIPSIEAAGKEAFDIPLGFLSLMDANGIPLGIKTMRVFSDPTNPDDPLYKTYNNFFTPPETYVKLLDEYETAEDKSRVNWVSDEEAEKEPEDPTVVDILKNRFLAVAFMTSVECVDAGVIDRDEVDSLCQNAFLWKEGPFAMMNKMGISEVLRIVTERMELSHRKAINFPIPQLLIKQAQKNESWPIKRSPIVYKKEQKSRAARITVSDPRTANALDDQVFEGLKASFQRANSNEDVKAIIFDSAPIKTFISGANASYFTRRIMDGDFLGLERDVQRWQNFVFHGMTGEGKPKIAIVDGAAIGGGVEMALAFALDPDSVVLATERTSYTFPETRLGIYPSLRGTLTLPQSIYTKTNDSEMAVALSRYYILAGGAATSSPRILKHLGLADLIVPAKDRDDAADTVVQAVVANNGKTLSRKQLESLQIDELPSGLSFQDKEELRMVKELFLIEDLIPTLYAYSRGLTEIPTSEENRDFVKKTAWRVAENSFHAVVVSDLLICKGFDGFLKGISMDDRARWELDNCLRIVLEHPDALEGLSAFLQKKSPEFRRRFPFSNRE
ncbi:MAG: 3-hydroxyacyl-CoA dehydrogenase NAD-binding domain-containing protein [Candidatus Aminicenantes bacterium]|jgi:enoyl-CoA hydratase/3-hydroxyacyl-CoA dehydrogenase